MKKIKHLLIALLSLITFNLFATPVSYTVTYNSTTNVTCNVGDTLKFFAIPPPTGSTYNLYGVFINTTTASGIKVNPTGVTPVNGYYIGKYVVTSGDSTFIIGRTINFSGTTIMWKGTININSTTGISLLSNTSVSELIVYPNPSKDFIAVKDIKTANVIVYDALGKQVKYREFVNEDIKLSIADLPQGIYYVEMKTNNRKSINKIIKE